MSTINLFGVSFAVACRAAKTNLLCHTSSRDSVELMRRLRSGNLHDKEVCCGYDQLIGCGPLFANLRNYEDHAESTEREAVRLWHSNSVTRTPRTRYGDDRALCQAYRTEYLSEHQVVAPDRTFGTGQEIEEK